MALPRLLRGTERWNYMTPRRILRLLGTRDDRVFVLGVNEERVTLLSQQTRALNLVHALHWAWPGSDETERLRERRVVIVGGGAGAATAATAAACLGAEVTLLADADLLSVQRTAAHRFLHPFSYEWPAPNWSRVRARLPLLDWTAADGPTVADRLEQETRAQSVALDFAIHENVAAPEIDVDSWSNIVTVRWRDAAGAPSSMETDLVILAVGFGREGQHPDPPAGVYWNSYWEDDDLHDSQGKILISGHGDGGLTEVLRCLIDGFDHADIVTLGHLALQEVPDPNAILEHELDLADARPGKGTRRFYESFYLPSLQDWLSDRIKPDTEVVVACRGEPLQRTSSPLNRLLVAQLAKGRDDIIRLDHRGVDGAGLRAAVDTGQAAPFTVPWADETTEQFQAVVVRHGTSIPRPLERYSGNFPPVLTRERVGEPLGWALDLTRFQWWNDSTFAACSGRRAGYSPTEAPDRTPAALVRAATGPRVPFLDMAGARLPDLPRRDATVAFLLAVVAWAGDSLLTVSESLLSRLVEERGERLDAVRSRIPELSRVRDRATEPTWWNWQDLRRGGDDDLWSRVRFFAREQLIVNLARRRANAPEEEEFIGVLVSRAADTPDEAARAAEALRRARPRDAAAALAVDEAVRGEGPSDEPRRTRMVFHALQRAAELGAEGDPDARVALARVAIAGFEPTHPASRPRPRPLGSHEHDVPERVIAGAMLLALSDPIAPATVERLLTSEGVSERLQAMAEYDPVVEKAWAFVNEQLSAGLRHRWERGFATTLYIAQRRNALGWPRRAVRWSSLFAFVDGDER